MKNRSKIYFLIICLLLIPQNVFARETSDLEIGSEAVVLMDAATGQILYGKNETKRMYPASITKIATAIYAIEKGNLQDFVIVSENATNVIGTTVYLEPGEKVTLEKLIIGMLVNSGNDAAIAIAEHLDGTVTNFSRNLNRFLQEKVGVTDTNFTNPHGLFAENHYTTAKDMALITRYAMANEQFMHYFQIKEYEWDGLSWDTTLHNHHRLVKGEFPYEGITGGKNGFVNESGFTLVTTAEREGRSLIVVTMNTHLRNVSYTDTLQLLDYGFDNFQEHTIPQGTVFEKNGEEFIVSENIEYLTLHEDTAHYEVNHDGVLHIKNDDNAVLATFPLTPVAQPASEVAESASTLVAEESSPINWKVMIPIVISICIVSFFGWITWRRWQIHKKQRYVNINSWTLERLNRK